MRHLQDTRHEFDVSIMGVSAPRDVKQKRDYAGARLENFLDKVTS